MNSKCNQIDNITVSLNETLNDQNTNLQAQNLTLTEELCGKKNQR